LCTVNETGGTPLGMRKLVSATKGSRKSATDTLNERTNSARLKKECILCYLFNCKGLVRLEVDCQMDPNNCNMPSLFGSAAKPNTQPAASLATPQSTSATGSGAEVDGDQLQRVKKYYDSLVASYNALTYQLQNAEKLSVETVAQLQERRKEVKNAIQQFLAKVTPPSNPEGKAAEPETKAPAISDYSKVQKPATPMLAESYVDASINEYSQMAQNTVATPAPILSIPFDSSYPTHSNPEIVRRRIFLDSLVHSIDPEANLDSEARLFLLGVADRFLSSVAKFSSAVAKSRGSATLDIDDVRLCLEQFHSIRQPNTHSTSRHSLSKTTQHSEKHRMRLQQVKKTVHLMNIKNERDEGNAGFCKEDNGNS